jgi:hypothetical protein
MDYILHRAHYVIGGSLTQNNDLFSSALLHIDIHHYLNLNKNNDITFFVFDWC